MTIARQTFAERFFYVNRISIESGRPITKFAIYFTCYRDSPGSSHPRPRPDGMLSANGVSFYRKHVTIVDALSNDALVLPGPTGSPSSSLP